MKNILLAARGAFSNPRCITYLYIAVLILFFKKDPLSTKKKKVLSILVWFLICLLHVIVHGMQLASRIVAENLWYSIYIFLVFVWFNKAIFERNPFSSKSISIISFFIMIAGVWTQNPAAPLFLFSILLVYIYKHFRRYGKYVAIIPLFLSTMLVCQLYNAINIKLQNVNEDGELYVETDITNKLYKIGMRGPWLKEFENLIPYIEKNIGKIPFVEIPCEDPIYWATGTMPQMSFFQLYPETCPYPKDKIIDNINKYGIKVIIVKRIHQFKDYMIPEEEIDDFEMLAKQNGYHLIDNCGIYDILRKQ